MINIVKEQSPHLRKRSSVARMMADVLIALLPAVVFSIVVHTWRAVVILAISLAVMIISEFVYFGIKNKMVYDGTKHPFKEKFKYAYSKYSINNILAPAVSAVIFAMILPASVADRPYVVVVGALAGIILGKLVFGGLGSNIFNPAAVGLVVAKISFGTAFTYTVDPFYDVNLGGTILTSISEKGVLQVTSPNNNILGLFLGTCPGALGEVSALCILVGAAYLLIRRSADFRPMIAYIGTFLVLMLVSGLCIGSKVGFDNNFYGKFILTELLSGGLLFGAVFMITDPVTSPINRPGRYIYGMLAGVFTVLIRLFAAIPEGVVFSILLVNMLAPVIDYYKWSGNKFTPKKLIWMGSILLVGIITVMIVLLSPGVVK